MGDVEKFLGRIIGKKMRKNEKEDRVRDDDKKRLVKEKIKEMIEVVKECKEDEEKRLKMIERGKVWKNEVLSKWNIVLKDEERIKIKVDNRMKWIEVRKEKGNIVEDEGKGIERSVKEEFINERNIVFVERKDIEGLDELGIERKLIDEFLKMRRKIGREFEVNDEWIEVNGRGKDGCD